YKIYEFNRKAKIGGGVCIYIKECLKIKIRDDINKEHLSENIESIFIEIENIK
ncbi:Hypothetical predicted protein, partial [Paramuricea clavata]